MIAEKELVAKENNNALLSRSVLYLVSYILLIT